MCNIYCIGVFMKNYYICGSIRLCRYLYSLGFDKKSINVKGKEIWQFEKSDEL